MINAIHQLDENLNTEGKTLKHELFEIETDIEYAKAKLEKAETLLNRWTQVYSFAEKPNPQAAMAWLKGYDKSQSAKHSAEWFWDYNIIFTIVDIAFDYLLEAKKILNDTINKEVVNK